MLQYMPKLSLCTSLHIKLLIFTFHILTLNVLELTVTMTMTLYEYMVGSFSNVPSVS